MTLEVEVWHHYLSVLLFFFTLIHSVISPLLNCKVKDFDCNEFETADCNEFGTAD